MKQLLIIFVLSVSLSGFSQEQKQTQNSSAAQSKGCIAVKDAGSHAFRNIMLGGLAGAIISKKQYKVLDTVDYPAKVGQKFHGNDLQMLQNGGTKVVILDKNFSQDELRKACH